MSSLLTFEHVSKRFDAERQVLRDVCLSVPRNGLSVVFGPSGTGKSVLCRIATGLLAPDAGTVTLLGELVTGASEGVLSRLRRRAPYVVQSSGLLDELSLEENVALAAAGRSTAVAAEALARVGLEAFAKRRPREVGPGTRKRAAIARALALRPAVMLLDEPTTGLDREAADQVERTLRALVDEGLGLFVISHDVARFRAWASRCYSIADGRLALEALAASSEAPGVAAPSGTAEPATQDGRPCAELPPEPESV